MTKEHFNRKAIGKKVYILPIEDDEYFSKGGEGMIVDVIDEESFLVEIGENEFGQIRVPVDMFHVRYQG